LHFRLLSQKFLVQENEVHSALLSGDPHNQLAIAYNLIVDNKRIEDETSKLDIKDFYVASSPPPQSNVPLESPGKAAPGNVGAIAGRQRMLSGGDKSKGMPIKRAKWHLGMFLFTSKVNKGISFILFLSSLKN
jgi:5'-AMP-activated protein kinase catalytic alpha subunit